MKLLAYILILLQLSSCAYRTLEGRVQPVYFSADSVVFSDTILSKQTVLYQNLKGLSYPCVEGVDLLQGEEVKTFISKPTIVRKENVEFLVYPREHILITADASKQYIPIFSTSSQNKVRDRELMVLKSFQQLEKRPKLPHRNDYTLLINYNFQTILDLEKIIKGEIAPAERASQLLFDSLCNVYQVSSKFRKLTKDYVRNKYDMTVLELYVTYRDTLMAHTAYLDKVKALLPEVNGVTNPSEFTFNLAQNTSGLYTCLYPDRGIRNMTATYGGVQECFDSIIANFNGVARDYLLSRVLFRAYTQTYDVTTPAIYRKTYQQYFISKDYRAIITRAARSAKHLQKNPPVLPNELLMVDGKTKVKFEDIIKQHKGKYVLVDLWASWCVPCIEEIPAWQALKKNYSSDEIAFLNVSLDRDFLKWRDHIRQFPNDSLSNYLLLHQTSAALVKQIGLSSIPRYLLYDREGNIINLDAPPPSDPELKRILDKLDFKERVGTLHTSSENKSK